MNDPVLLLTMLRNLALNKKTRKKPANQKKSAMAMSTNTQHPQTRTGCHNKKHNPAVKSHTEENCWVIYPKKKEEFMAHNSTAVPAASSSLSLSQHQVPAFAAVTTAHCHLTSFLSASAILDSGALHHMFNSLDYFLDTSTCSIPMSTGRNSTNLTAIQTGTALIAQSDGKLLELVDALFVPGLSRNLISMNQLVKKSAVITCLNQLVRIVIDEIITFDFKKNNNIMEIQGAIGPVSREASPLVTTTHSLSTSAFKTWHN
jgi:hypothetical protein